MCLPVSIKKTSKSSFFIPNQAITNSSSLTDELPPQLLRLIEDWYGNKEEYQFKTSGSTGTPKTITLNRQQILDSAQRTIKVFNLNSQLTALIALNLDYIAGFMMLIRALEAKMNIHYFEPTSDPFENLLPDQRYFMALVPLQFQKLTEKKHQLNNVDSIIIGGSSLSSDLKKKSSKFEFSIYETYGMTETVSHIALRHIISDESNNHFQVLDGIQIRSSSDNCLEIKGDVTLHE